MENHHSKGSQGTPCTAHVSRELVAGFWKRLELPKYGSCWSAFPLTPILYNEVLVSITRKSVFKFTKTGIDYGDYGGPMDRSSVRSWCGSNWVAPESADRGLATNSPCQAGTIDGLKNNWVNLVGAGIFGEGHDSDYIVIICDYNEFEEKTCLQIQVVYLRLDPLMVIILLSQSQLGASCHAACGRCWEDYYCRKIWKKENEGKWRKTVMRPTTYECTQLQCTWQNLLESGRCRKFSTSNLPSAVLRVSTDRLI